MRIVCCSHWPTWPCPVIQTFFPHILLLKLLYPKCNCAYINTFIPIHCLNIAMNVDGRKFFLSQELNNGTLFEPHVLTAFISTGTETQLWIAVGSRLRMVRGRYPLSAWNRFYPVFFISIKIMTEKAKLFQPVRIYGGNGIRGCRRDSSNILAQDRVYWQTCHIVVHKRRKISSRAAWWLVSVKGPWSIRLVMSYKEIKLAEWIRSTLRNKQRQKFLL